MINVQSLLVGDVCRMSSIERYSNYPTLHKENVAEHSYYVAFYALMISRDLQSRGAKIDISKVLSRCIMHDLDEALTGDFVRSFKYSSEELRLQIEKSSITLLQLILDNLLSGNGEVDPTIREDLHDYWLRSKDRDAEGLIVQFCDFLSVISYSVREINLGNSNFTSLLKEVLSYVDEFLEKVPEHQHIISEYFKKVFLEIIDDLIKPIT